MMKRWIKRANVRDLAKDTLNQLAANDNECERAKLAG